MGWVGGRFLGETAESKANYWGREAGEGRQISRSALRAALRRFHPNEQVRRGPRPSAVRNGSSTRAFMARLKPCPSGDGG